VTRQKAIKMKIKVKEQNYLGKKAEREVVMQTDPWQGKKLHQIQHGVRDKPC
jgi:hypothetical protein